MSTVSSPIAFIHATRINRSLTANLELRTLCWLAQRLPSWVTPDQLTVLGLLAQVGAGIAFAWARHHAHVLWLVILCVALNWFGDSLDGTLARVRAKPRPRFGFYVDHIVDILGAVALMSGLAYSGFVHASIAFAMLIAFLVLASESYLATYTLGRFELSPGLVGSTEIRILLIAGVLALLRCPYSHIFGHTFLLFDIGGVIATAGMALTALVLTTQHTAKLFYEEPIA